MKAQDACTRLIVSACFAVIHAVFASKSHTHSPTVRAWAGEEAERSWCKPTPRVSGASGWCSGWRSSAPATARMELESSVEGELSESCVVRRLLLAEQRAPGALAWRGTSS